MRTFVVMMCTVLAGVLLSSGPAIGTNPAECSSAAEEGGACPRHGLTGGGTRLYVDCDGGLAFASSFSGAKINSVFIPQLNNGNDAVGDVFRWSQENALTLVTIFDPDDFPTDPVECAGEVGRAIVGLVGPPGCLSHAECPEGAFCIGPAGCAYPCGACPIGFSCPGPSSPRCFLRRIAIGAAYVVETLRATGPTSQVAHVTAHGILDLLDEAWQPTGQKVMFRGNGRIVWGQESFFPVKHEARIELQEYSGP